MNKISRIVLLLLTLAIERDIYSQQLSHQVLVPVAGVSVAGAINYSQTIGETAVEIFSTDEITFTQGFQQPRVNFIPAILPAGNGVDVYPNPAVDNVTVKLFGEDSRDLRVEIINISGTVVYTEKVSFTGKYYLEKVIPVSSYYKGIYLIRIISTDKLINRSFKIEKM